MTQVTSTVGGQTAPELDAENLAVSLAAAGNTVLLTLPVSKVSRIAVQIDVTVQALDAFIVTAKFHRNAAAQTLYSTAGDFTVPTGAMVAASGNLTAQAAATTGWFIMDTTGMVEVQILGSAAVDGALVDARAFGSGRGVV